jgi:glycolate oxidase FAD binding subunit
MKNVTGLDLVKLSCGAFGTLGLLTEVTFKVLPAPKHVLTLVFEGLSNADALNALALALGSPFEVSGAAHLPAGIVRLWRGPACASRGFEPSVLARAGALGTRLAAYGSPASLTGDASAALWADIRDCAFLADPPDGNVWRLNVPPTEGARVMARLKRLDGARHYFDWGGGLIWIALAAEAAAADIRAAALASSGYATLVRAGHDIRAATPVLQPLPDALMRLTTGIKASFDPDRILNPSRMYAGV